MASLSITEKDKTWTVPLRDDLTALGREATCQVQLNDEKLSRKHCRVERKKGSYVLVDLSSKNGTYVNGVAVFPSRALRDGDEIKLGDVRAVFHNRSLSDRFLYFLHHRLVWRIVWTAAIGGSVYGLYRVIKYFFTTMLK